LAVRDICQVFQEQQLWVYWAFCPCVCVCVCACVLCWLTRWLCCLLDYTESSYAVGRVLSTQQNMPRSSCSNPLSLREAFCPAVCPFCDNACGCQSLVIIFDQRMLGSRRPDEDSCCCTQCRLLCMLCCYDDRPSYSRLDDPTDFSEFYANKCLGL